MVTAGSWDRTGAWKSVFGWDRPVLRELFQTEVFRFLRERELLSVERIDLIRSWRHSGFDVFVGELIAPDDRRALEHIARYLIPVRPRPIWKHPPSMSRSGGYAGPS